MDPIKTIENELRNLIHDVLSDKFGISWTDNIDVGLTKEWTGRGNLEEKAKRDRSIRGDVAIYDMPLAYSEFSHLKIILENRKSLFEEVFKEWEKTMQYLSVAENFRNALAHNRDITPTQQQLLIGIAGEIMDDIYLWRIGTSTAIKETVIEFRDYIPTENKMESEVLEASRVFVVDLNNLIVDALKKSGFDDKKIVEKREEFVSQITAPQISVDTHTSPKGQPNSQQNGVKCKSFITSIRYKPACKVDLNSILTCFGRQYFSIQFVLNKPINVDSLVHWSVEKAGLNPGSTVKSGGAFDNVDYKLLNGKLRINVSRSGSICLTCEDPESFWFPHRVISPDHLFGFVLGNITPRAMMHLHQRSFLSLSTIGDSSSSDR